MSTWIFLLTSNVETNGFVINYNYLLVSILSRNKRLMQYAKIIVYHTDLRILPMVYNSK